VCNLQNQLCLNYIIQKYIIVINIKTFEKTDNQGSLKER
jgi:hypothetical protein